MRNSLFLSFVSTLFVSACSSESTVEPPVSSDAGTEDAAQSTESDSSTTDSGSDGGSVSYVDPVCTLQNDTGGPGQYTDTCVQRAWIQDYAGTYTSAACELTIAIDGGVAATFTMKVLSGPQAGTYVIDWEGASGGGGGNDSYYRFTTDATFATTKTLNFNAGQKVGAGTDERNAALRVEDIDKGTVVYKGRYGQFIGGQNDEVDCGAMTKK